MEEKKPQTLDEDKELYIEKEFAKHSKRSSRIRAKLAEKKRQLRDLKDAMIEKFKSLPKWVRYSVGIPLGIIYTYVCLMLIQGIIKAEPDEYLRLLLCIILLIIIWALLKWVFII